jgi:hypothetical protein
MCSTTLRYCGSTTTRVQDGWPRTHWDSRLAVWVVSDLQLARQHTQAWCEIHTLIQGPMGLHRICKMLLVTGLDWNPIQLSSLRGWRILWDAKYRIRFDNDGNLAY